MEGVVNNELDTRSDKPLLAPPQAVPHVYDYHFLELASAIEQGGTIILNPRDLSMQSLFLVDLDFRYELALYNQWKKYKRDQRKVNHGTNRPNRPG